MVRGGLSDEDREDLGKRLASLSHKPKQGPVTTPLWVHARKGEEAIGQDPAPHTFLV